MSASEMNSPVRPQPPDGRRLVTDLLTGGGVTLLVGFVLLVVARVFLLLAIPGVVCAAVGVGLLLAGCIIYPFMRRPGLAV